MVVSENIQNLILNKQPVPEIKRLAISEGMKTLAENGRQKVVDGVSTSEEVERVVSTGV